LTLRGQLDADERFCVERLVACAVLRMDSNAALDNRDREITKAAGVGLGTLDHEIGCLVE
jgi:hypothetical protein